MTNILTQEYKKEIQKEYRYRLYSVVLFLFSFLMIGASILLVPSYLMSGTVEKTLQGKIDSAKSTDDAERRANTQNELTEISTKITYLKGQQSLFDTEELLRTLVALKPSGISLTGLSFGGGEQGNTIEVAGTADLRSDLLLFNERLEEEEAFTDVNLPVSNLTQGSDISFSLTLTLPAPEPVSLPEAPAEDVPEVPVE